tara:strand:+ start:7680 stop:8438 length:759 start_codon:yes stop_codon:yes gene_type:complete
MKKVRKAIFETNSSSSHSIHIDSDVSLMDTSLIPNEDGEISIIADEYGWEWAKLETAYEKACYCYTDNGNTSMLEKVIKDQTGAKKINFGGEGYVDHNSGGNASDAFKDEETLRNLIFNTKSIIYTGNDNGEPPLHFYCDSSNGRYKVTVIKEDILREMNIDTVLGEKTELKDSDFEWTYSFENTEEQITEASHEFMNNYLEGEFGYHYDKDYWTNTVIDVKNKKVIATKTDRKTKEIVSAKELMIIIKENK